MGKESYQLLIANNVGGYVEHPFYGSALYNKFDDDDFLEEEEEDEPEIDLPYIEGE